MKKNITLLIIISAVFVFGILKSCRNDFLTIPPNGSLSEDVLANDYGINKLLIGAYSMLDGVSDQYPFDFWYAASSNWLWSSIRGLEASKGSDSGDQPDINSLQTFAEQSTNSYLNNAWRILYESIARCNTAISVTKKALAKSAITQVNADLYIEQARALRGWYHFEAWRMWEKIPYVDETTDARNVTNTEDVKVKIIADLTEGTKLPDNMEAIGRFNGTVAKCILGKALMQMNHDWAGALTLLQGAKTGTKPDGTPIGFAATYGEIFDIANRNGIETIYTVQTSVNDGSGGANGGAGETLNFPYNNGPGRCCGFFCPTQEFVNSFRTSGGLPLLNGSYNTGANQVKNDEGLSSSDPFTPDAGPLDPRLDWSVGRRGIPYWDWGKHTGMDWIRQQSYSGPYSVKKLVYKSSQEDQFTEVGGWTAGWTANGYRLMRYSDIILMIAECQIETNDLPGARTNINLIRARAANPAGFVMDGATPAANYVINQYPLAGYPFDTQANARIALQMERKLELGQEGHRFFDLNRWGNTVTELNRILTYEKTLSWGTKLWGVAVVGPEDVTYPLPQRQIDLSNGKLVQNR